MNYVDPVKYSKAILALMEDESMPQEETIPVKGNKDYDVIIYVARLDKKYL